MKNQLSLLATAVLLALCISGGASADSGDNSSQTAGGPGITPDRREMPATAPDVADKIAAAQRTRAFLDSPIAPATPAPGTTTARHQQGDSRFNPLIYAALGLLAALVLMAAAILFRMSAQAGAVRPSMPSAATTSPQLGIVMPERTDYPSFPNDRFMDSIVEEGIINQDERTALAARFNNNAFAILLFLADEIQSDKAVLGQLWGSSIGVAYVDPFKIEIQHDTLPVLPAEFLKARPILPLYEFEGVLTVATYNPSDSETLKQAENLTGKFISPVFSFPGQITAGLAISRTTVSELSDKMHSLPSQSALGQSISTSADADWANKQIVTEFALDMLLLAIRKRASDIHIEPHEEAATVRYRIDGVLQKIMEVNLAHLPYLTNVLKIRAGVDIAERRRPQDGHITLDLAGRSLDIRFSSVPTMHGEKLVLRLLGQNQFKSIPGLEELDCSASVYNDINRIINSPSGVFFVTGPTGSGKTTTLYSALKAINKSGINIMTVEDPIEYHLPGLNQVQVNPLAGVTFASALRAFLRQDPDVILLGEVRDLETAKVAAQAALTGHLVLTTMHTNNALQAITRLVQIGVEPFLVAPSIIGVMGQRLIRRLCMNCREKYEMKPDEIRAIFEWDEKTPVYAYRAKGCKECDFTGYSGRIAIHELFLIDDETREQIAHDATILDITRTASRKGFTTMRYDGIKKVLRGLTTLEEVNYATMEFN